MTSITIRDLDEKTVQQLRLRAARRRRSMEQEALLILRSVLGRESDAVGNLAEAIRRRFIRLGGVDLDLPPRVSPREPLSPRLRSRH